MSKTSPEKLEYMKQWRRANPDYWRQWRKGERQADRTYAGRPIQTPEERRARQNARKQAQYQLQRQYLRDLKSATPCADCAVTYPYYVMQFDHVRGGKKFNISKYFGGWVRLQEEVEKCDVVCANCHAERSFRRLETPEA